jgi:hypothetical protein
MTSVLSAVLLCATVASDSSAQTAAFTYQGRLLSDGNTANGHHDFQFTLFALESGGSPSSDALILSAVGVTNGLFTVALDFGADAFTGMSRWLDIAVRPAGSGAFTALVSRQAITPAPLAMTAWSALTARSVPGLDRFALHSADGSVTNALRVDDGGEVGIGTIAPVSRLHVVSTAADVVPPRLQSAGTDRFSAGWDFYHGEVGKGYVGVPDAGAPIGAGEMLVYGGPGTKASLWAGGTRALTASASRVGIGTTAPRAALDVRGDVLLGPGGEWSAVGGEENLRIVRGKVGFSGIVLAGRGFQVSHEPVTTPYTVTFNPPFAAAPVVTATIERTISNGFVVASSVTANSVTFTCYSGGGGLMASDFNFIAIGPR